MFGVAVAVDAKRNAADTACSSVDPTIVLPSENVGDGVLKFYCFGTGILIEWKSSIMGASPTTYNFYIFLL